MASVAEIQIREVYAKGGILRYDVRIGSRTIGTVSERLRTRDAGPSLELYPWKAILWTQEGPREIGHFDSVLHAADAMVERHAG